MKAWKVTLIGACLAAANGAAAIANNVTITGERIGVNPLPSLNLSHDLRRIAYASERPSPLKFPSPLSQRTGEIQLPGAFNRNDPRDRNGNVISPDGLFGCTPILDRWCGNHEIMAFDGAGASALRFNLGANVDTEIFETARLQMNRMLEKDYGWDTSDAGHPENHRVDGMSPSGLDDLDIFAGGKAL